MGMRIGASSPAAAGQGNSVSAWHQRQQSFNELNSALQSGNLSGAQQTFSKLAGSSNIQGDSALGQLGQALQNGDLAGAQKAAQAIQERRGSQAGGSTGQATATAVQVSSNPPGVGTLIDTTA